MLSSQSQSNYVGWVPCLSGQLVFELVECGLKDNAYDTTEIIHHARDNNGKIIECILLQSTVNWKDFGGTDLHGLWSVILFSKRILGSNYHEGSVYFMPKGGDDSPSWNDALDLARNINLQLNTELSPDVLTQLLDFEGIINNTCLPSTNCFRAKFRLEHDGIVGLESLAKEKDEQKIIARQAYYYIKYAWHKHRHHDSRAETLTTIHNVCLSNRKEYIAEVLIDDLKRNLVQFKRDADHTSHREMLKAKGIISYAKALVEIMKSRGLIDNDYYTKELNHLGYFKESLDIISSGIEKDISLHNQSVNDARALILFIFAMFTPALIFNKEAINQLYNSATLPKYVQWIGDLYSNGSSFAVFICLTIIYFFVYISFQTHYGNFWIFWGGFKKSVGFIVKDRSPNLFLSNSTVLSTIILLMGLCAVIFGIHGLLSSL